MTDRKRYCCNCGTEVFECMASVKAGDFVLATEGKIRWDEIRELCGKCTMHFILTETFPKGY